jgi:YesN/AraC family two-component response regulator
VQPHALCFEFDYPDPSGLTLLKETKHRYPSIPFVMLAASHAGTLAVWALRARVWNYFVKPVAQTEIVRSLMPLLRAQVSKGWHRRAPRLCITPEQNISNGPSSLSLSRSEQAILKARRFIESHLEDKLSARMLARYCGLSPAYFSRTFKRVTGLSFRAFLPQARVKRALQLLENESLTVTQVCLQAGLSNLSHFTLMFRRYVSVSPSIYQARLQQSRIKGLWDRIYKTLLYALTHAPLLLPFPLEPPGSWSDSLRLVKGTLLLPGGKSRRRRCLAKPADRL